MAGSRRTIAWLQPDQIGLVRAVVREAELVLVGAGTPARGQSVHLAADLETKACDDLRAALATADCAMIWIAAPIPPGPGGVAEDAAAIGAAHARGVRVATLEPIPAAALDLDSGSWTVDATGGKPVDAVRFVPLARHSKTFREAAEILPSFGAIGTMLIEAWCGPGEGSLGARLYASLELVHSLMGEPETIDASYVTAAPGRAVHALPGESLRNLRGDLSANLRFADGRTATLIASDRAGRWNRAVTVVGPGGRLRIFDDGFEWIGPAGDRLDHARKRTRGQPPETPYAANAMAESLSRLLDPDQPPEPPTDHAALLAIAQAALLSCRTGQGESPSTIRRMVGAP